MVNAPETLWQLVGVAVLVATNGFFVAAEFGLVTVRRTRIEQLAAEGHGAARVVGNAIADLDRYIAGTQVGITLASLALGWIGEPAIADLIKPLLHGLEPDVSEFAVHSASVGIAFTTITFLHVILGELVPKSLALQKPEATALAVARPMLLAVWIFRPLIWSLNGLGNLILRAFGLSGAANHEAVHTARELELLVRESHKAGMLDDLEKTMLQRTFRFTETTVDEVMVPRAEMKLLDIELPTADLLKQAARLGHSRLPVFREHIDQIEGVVYIHDLFRWSQEGRGPLKDCLRTPLFVPESLHLDRMIERFKTHRTQIAIVVDEFGSTAGIITLEDIVEAVFGEIQDQNEDPTPAFRTEKDGIIVIRGDARLVELEEAFGWRFEVEAVDTVAGFIMERLGRVPRVNDTVENGACVFRVTKMDRQRIVEVRVQSKARHA